MIGHATWRNLIYKLAEDYPESLMLMFTVKLISDAGFQGEITSISTASQQLEVFTRILKTSINTFLETGEEKLSNLMEFTVCTFFNTLLFCSPNLWSHFFFLHPPPQKLVCHGEHTFLYSQALMHLLSLEPKGGSNIKRLSQEICKFAQKQ